MQVLRLLSWWWYLTTQIVIGSWNVDAALLASILGILATIALARIMTRGRR